MGMTFRSPVGPERTVESAVIERLRAGLRGSLLEPGAPGYDEARVLWNAMIDRNPGLIARCASTSDVVDAVNFAREQQVAIAVRGGGHNIAGSASVDGGLVIDLSPMRRIDVDPQGRLVRAAAGVTLGELDAATQAHGLATPVGVNSTTGLAGLTLGGGFGWLSRKHGLTVDNLVSAEVVTARGDVVRTSAKENADLFWGIRGGGGNFGVVTSFELRLHPVGPQVLAGLVVYPLELAPELLRFHAQFAPEAPDELSCWIVLRLAPPVPFIPTEWHGREVIVLATCWCGDLAAGERALVPLRTFGHPIADVVAPQPFVQWQQALDPLLTAGMRNYWKSHDFRTLSEPLADALVAYARRIPDPNSDILLAHLGGAVKRVDVHETAYAHRDAEFVMNVHGRWADAKDDARCIAWTRELFDAAAPFASGAYVNFMTGDEEDRVRSAYGDNYETLATLKERWDPTNLFRVNQNIRPT